MSNRIGSVLVLCCLSALAGAAELNGELDWADRVTLSVPVSGIVAKVSVRPGEAVAAGQALLELDAREVQAHVAQANSAVKKLELHRAEAEREWERAQELFDRTVLSERELQLAEIGLNDADAAYRAAQTERVAAEVALECHQIKAPFAAWVLAVPVAPGQAVVNTQHATPLVTLAARERMRVRVDIDAAQAATLKLEAGVGVRVGAQRFDAHVVHIGLEPTGSQRPPQYPVEVEFNVPADTQLRAGQAAVLELP
ncbi:MAG: efflux RND transporter periplasmic adaptor subunit [Gammaproteobacteria bacterium]|nr:efflux RND transporter periplasmic adaptor subunit [Gammaproteobacteria bacterium]